ncbi:adenylate kinase [Bifidobacterium sp. DSM 109958]|uniref:Adenylate kinase n=1 Tax=Bifidobacterium moraviense TaxID=2675323 RepID=A0A7Y0F3J3_9BIFI|nr:Topology modulation protein [Bifidobacterium sp. DSM 109958]NMN01377.1 adenylate kinase [Bifidobacterium sp. DSM 109958]
MRISIMGLSGSGKSTLARALGEELRSPVLHLDTVQFLPGWENRPMDQQLGMVSDFLDEHGSWVIDGNYTNLHVERRLRESDCIVILLFGRITRVRRVIARARRYRGTARPSMTPGCNERINADFLWWVIWRGCDRAHLRYYRDVARRYPSTTVVIRTQRELDRWLRDALPQLLRR